MKSLYLITPLLFFMSSFCFSQVGIGTMSPNASSILDITATDKGMLVPRVSLPDISDLNLDGTNPAVPGLLIWNTNATTSGGAGIGFYVFNGSFWEKLSTGTSGHDQDWHEQGTAISPDDINDNIFTNGSVGINTDALTAIKLNVFGTGTANTIGNFESIATNDDPKTGSNIVMNGSGNGIQYGIRNNISNSGDADHFGTHNALSGSGTGIKYGTYNTITSTSSSQHYGIYNDMAGENGNSKTGTYNLMRTMGGINFGTANIMLGSSSGTQYAVNNIVSTLGTGNRYAINNSFINSNDGDDYGVFTRMQGGGAGLKYGSHTVMNVTGSGAKYGSYIEIGPATTGQVYGYYATVPQTTGFAAILNGNVVINEDSDDFNFRVETDNKPYALFSDGANNVIRFGTQAGNLFGNGTAINSVTVDYVADFDNNVGGTALGIGSAEYLLDGGANLIRINGSFTPIIDDNYDLGSATYRWDDVYATSGVVNTSDIRLKKNIKNLEYGLSEILKINPISYQWKNGNDQSTKLGFSAQELLTIIPEVIKTEDVVYDEVTHNMTHQPNENLGVYYSDIIPILTKAIQEQQTIIENLKNRIELLEIKE